MAMNRVSALSGSAELGRRKVYVPYRRTPLISELRQIGDEKSIRKNRRVYEWKDIQFKDCAG